VNVVGTLHRTPDRHTALGVGEGKHAVRLDIQLLLRSRRVFPFNDQGCTLQNGIDITFFDVVGFEEIVAAPNDLSSRQCIVNRQDRGERLDVDVDFEPRLLRPRAIGMRKEQNWLLGVIHDGICEVWLIVDDQFDAVEAGDVRRRDDGELVPGNGRIEADALDAAARDRAAHCHAM
jgi:hypothetical protein